LALVPLDGPWRALWSPGERFEHVEKPPCPLFSRSGQKASSRKIDFERFAGLAPQMGGEILHAAEPSLLSTKWWVYFTYHTRKPDASSTRQTVMNGGVCMVSARLPDASSTCQTVMNGDVCMVSARQSVSTFRTYV
jgi:hypothetical protein